MKLIFGRRGGLIATTPRTEYCIFPSKKGFMWPHYGHLDGVWWVVFTFCWIGFSRRPLPRL